MDNRELPNIADTNYRIESLLGSGGGGDVYKAWHARLQKYVALKRVNMKHDASRAEVDMLKDLKHEGLPQVYDFLTDESGFYTVMEFIPGQNFAQLLSNGKRFDQKQVIEWARSISGALAYLHGRNPSILHSDIKPANVMLTPEGDVCLIDFNVSLLLNGENANVIGRSHGYASPEQYGPEALPRSLRVVPENPLSALPSAENIGDSEQLEAGEHIDSAAQPKATEYLGNHAAQRSGSDNSGDTDIIRYDATESNFSPAPQLSSSAQERAKIRMDARSDIYSFGATLYHLLTGEKPAIASGEVTPLSAYDLGLSQAIVYIVERCMERDPGKRFQTASELHRAFGDIRKLDSRWRRQNAAKNAAVLVLAALFVISGVSTTYGWRRMGEERVASFNELVHQIPLSDDDEPYNMAIALFPDRLEARRAYALKLYSQRLFDECTEYISETMTRFMAFSWGDDELLIIGDIYYIEGNAWFELENYPKAVAAYEAAVANNPYNPEMFRDYAIALARTGLAERAEELLIGIREMKIGYDSIQLLQGEIAYARRNYEEAIALFHSVVYNSDNPLIRQRAYLINERAHRRLPDRLYERIELLRYALSDLPSVYHAAVMERLAEALTAAGELSGNPEAYYNEAIEIFAELRSRGNVSYATAQNIGLLYQRLGNFTAARELYLELSESFPHDYRSFMRLAYLVLEEQSELTVDERDYREAVEWFDKGMNLYDRRSSSAGDDMEMLTLRQLMEELRLQGWL